MTPDVRAADLRVLYEQQCDQQGKAGLPRLSLHDCPGYRVQPQSQRISSSSSGVGRIGRRGERAGAARIGGVWTGGVRIGSTWIGCTAGGECSDIAGVSAIGIAMRAIAPKQMIVTQRADTRADGGGGGGGGGGDDIDGGSCGCRASRTGGGATGLGSRGLEWRAPDAGFALRGEREEQL